MLWSCNKFSDDFCKEEYGDQSGEIISPDWLLVDTPYVKHGAKKASFMACHSGRLLLVSTRYIAQESLR